VNAEPAVVVDPTPVEEQAPDPEDTEISGVAPLANKTVWVDGREYLPFLAAPLDEMWSTYPLSDPGSPKDSFPNAVALSITSQSSSSSSVATMPKENWDEMKRILVIHQQQAPGAAQFFGTMEQELLASGFTPIDRSLLVAIRNEEQLSSQSSFEQSGFIGTVGPNTTLSLLKMSLDSGWLSDGMSFSLNENSFTEIIDLPAADLLLEIKDFEYSQSEINRSWLDPNSATTVWKSAPLMDLPHQSNFNSFFDPVKNMVWSSEDQFVSQEVSRDAYNQQLFPTIENSCPECASHLSTTTSDIPKLRTTGICGTCQKNLALSHRFLLGHRLRGQQIIADHSDHTIVKINQIASATGIYPICQMPAGTTGDSSYGIIDNDVSENAFLNFIEENLVKESVAIAQGSTAIILPTTFLNYDASGNIAQLPNFDELGQLQYEKHDLAGSLLTQSFTNVQGKVRFRVVGVKDAIVYSAGTVEMSFLDTLGGSFIIDAGSNGPKTEMWPTVGQQIEALTPALLGKIPAIIMGN